MFLSGARVRGFSYFDIRKCMLGPGPGYCRSGSGTCPSMPNEGPRLVLMLLWVVEGLTLCLMREVAAHRML